MKFAVAAASVLASVYSQTQPQTTPKLDAKCLDDGNGIERLLIEIQRRPINKNEKVPRIGAFRDWYFFRTHFRTQLSHATSAFPTIITVFRFWVFSAARNTMITQKMDYRVACGWKRPKIGKYWLSCCVRMLRAKVRAKKRKSHKENQKINEFFNFIR